MMTAGCACLWLERKVQTHDAMHSMTECTLGEGVRQDNMWLLFVLEVGSPDWIICWWNRDPGCPGPS